MILTPLGPLGPKTDKINEDLLWKLQNMDMENKQIFFEKTKINFYWTQVYISQRNVKEFT